MLDFDVVDGWEEEELEKMNEWRKGWRAVPLSWIIHLSNC
jgi:hypothetical protein